METLAHAVAEGARGVAGVNVVVKRGPETLSEDVARKVGVKLDQAANIFVTTLMHHGMIYVGLPDACPELADITRCLCAST